MKTKIPLQEVKIGMYIDGIDEPWIKTPFLTHHFTIRNESQIQNLRSLGLTQVTIDTDKGSLPDERIPAQGEQEVLQNPQGPQKKEQRPLHTYTKEELGTYYGHFAAYTQIDKKTLIGGTSIDFSLYVKNGLAVVPLLAYDKHSIEITGRLLSIEDDLLIEKTAKERYKAYLKDLVVSHAAAPPREVKHFKAILIRENSKFLMQEVLDDPRSGERIKQCRESVEEIVDMVQKNGTIISDLLTLNKYDYYTYTHCVNVCVLAVGLCLALDVFGESQVYRLGMGALLHDIGKSEIPIGILNKPDKLTDEEFTIMKKHVLMAKEILAKQKSLLKEIYYPVMQHHEKMTGKGYPRGLTGDSIDLSGRIVSLIDTYDALTTARPYKPALSPFQALSVIRRQLSDYDKEYFIHFVKLLGNVALMPVSV